MWDTSLLLGLVFWIELDPIPWLSLFELHESGPGMTLPCGYISVLSNKGMHEREDHVHDDLVGMTQLA
jgi:hypothetical protein